MSESNARVKIRVVDINSEEPIKTILVGDVEATVKDALKEAGVELHVGGNVALSINGRQVSPEDLVSFADGDRVTVATHRDDA